MAGFVTSPNTIKVLWHVSTHGRPQLYVQHAQYTLAGPLNPSIAETIYASFRATMVSSAAMQFFATTFSFTGVGVIDLRSPNNPELPSSSAALPGTALAGPMPDQVACVVTLRTALTGRSHRGRQFIFGWPENASDAAGLINDNTAGTAAATVNAMQAGIAAAGATLAIHSPALPERPSKPGGTLPEKPFSITPVTTVVVRDRVWDTNRRRVDQLRR